MTDAPEITTTLETAQGAAEVQTARLDGEAAFRAWLMLCLERPRTLNRPRDWGSAQELFDASSRDWHALGWWDSWCGHCLDPQRDFVTGELTEAERADKEQAERVEKQAKAARECVSDLQHHEKQADLAGLVLPRDWTVHAVRRLISAMAATEGA